VKADAEDTQYRSTFVSVVKLCVMKYHVLTKWITENFAHIFALGVISGKKKSFM